MCMCTRKTCKYGGWLRKPFWSFYNVENKVAHSCAWCTFANNTQQKHKKCIIHKFVCVFALP